MTVQPSGCEALQVILNCNYYINSVYSSYHRNTVGQTALYMQMELFVAVSYQSHKICFSETIPELKDLEIPLIIPRGKEREGKPTLPHAEVWAISESQRVFQV